MQMQIRMKLKIAVMIHRIFRMDEGWLASGTFIDDAKVNKK